MTSGLKESIELAKGKEATCPACRNYLSLARIAMFQQNITWTGLLARRLHRHVTRAHGKESQ
ncbi:MAG: hypothetical protein Q8P59_05775 [Dehalococcoidia bacterium]|nr:hypothetical protein [Dehalococcoidia bacterium]